MKNKKIISVIAIIMAVLMLLSLVTSVIPIIAHADEYYEQRLAELQAERDEKTAKIGDATKRLTELNEEKAAVIDQKMALEERNTAALEDLAIIQKQIDLYTEMIKEKSKEVDVAKEREALQLQRYRMRVRSMEESENYNILSLIIRADNFAELIAAIDDYAEIMESDKKASRQYEAARKETEAVKAGYEEYKAGIEAQQKILAEEQKSLQADITASQELIKELSKTIEEVEEEKRAAEEAEAEAAIAINAFIADYLARIAAQRAQYAESAGNTGAGEEGYTGQGYEEGGYEEPYITGATGSFAWPVPSSIRVSSTYKWRWGRQHTGTDIDGYGLDGYPVVAADGGQVIMADWNGGYGNCVMIDHGNGYITLYGHLSGFAVWQGDYVSQGQTIGYLGQTGNAYGTHLHYEVRQNGSTIDPMQFYGGYVLEPGAAD